MKAVLLIILIGVAVSLAGDGTCKKFTIWNPNTNDTLYHFFRGKGQVGDCWYDYHMIGHRVECSNPYVKIGLHRGAKWRYWTNFSDFSN